MQKYCGMERKSSHNLNKLQDLFQIKDWDLLLLSEEAFLEEVRTFIKEEYHQFSESEYGQHIQQSFDLSHLLDDPHGYKIANSFYKCNSTSREQDWLLENIPNAKKDAVESIACLPDSPYSVPVVARTQIEDDFKKDVVWGGSDIKSEVVRKNMFKYLQAFFQSIEEKIRIDIEEGCRSGNSINTLLNEDFIWFPSVVDFDANRVLMTIIGILYNDIDSQEDIFTILLILNSVSQSAVTLLRYDSSLKYLLAYGKDDTYYLTYGINSYGAKGNSYSEKNDELTRSKNILGHPDEDTSSFLKRVSKIIENENNNFVSNELDKKHVDRAITQTATELNNWGYPHKRDEGWNRMYGSQITSIRDEIGNSSKKNDAPWCYYQALLGIEDPRLLLSLKDDELIQELAELFNTTSGTYRSLLYKAIYIINYIKGQQGIVDTPLEPYDYSMDDSDPLISDILEFVKPIFNETFINTAVLSINAFIAIFKKALKCQDVYPRLKKIGAASRNLSKEFNVPLVGNIIGCLIDTIVITPKIKLAHRLFYNSASPKLITIELLGKDNRTMRGSMASTKAGEELGTFAVKKIKEEAQNIFEKYIVNKNRK